MEKMDPERLLAWLLWIAIDVKMGAHWLLHCTYRRAAPGRPTWQNTCQQKSGCVCARWDLLIRGCSIKHVIIFLLRRSICKQLWSQSWWTICCLVITEFLIKMKTSKPMFIISSEMTCPSHSPDSEPHLSPYRGGVTCVQVSLGMLACEHVSVQIRTCCAAK